MHRQPQVRYAHLTGYAPQRNIFAPEPVRPALDAPEYLNIPDSLDTAEVRIVDYGGDFQVIAPRKAGKAVAKDGKSAALADVDR